MITLKEKVKSYDDFFDLLKSNGRLNRFGKLFKTKKNGYIYDLGTGKILQCDEKEYRILECIFENEGPGQLHKLEMDELELLEQLEKIKDVIKKEKLLQHWTIN